MYALHGSRHDSCVMCDVIVEPHQELPSHLFGWNCGECYEVRVVALCLPKGVELSIFIMAI